ncbi:MAG: hypothetical protein ACFFD2_22585, partial [Promethearchaeota archaeon]
MKILGAIDRATAFGCQTGGPVSCEVKAALHETKGTATIFPIINGLGGREVTLEQQKNQLLKLVKYHETGELPKDVI